MCILIHRLGLSKEKKKKRSSSVHLCSVITTDLLNTVSPVKTTISKYQLKQREKGLSPLIRMVSSLLVVFVSLSKNKSIDRNLLLASGSVIVFHFPPRSNTIFMFIDKLNKPKSAPAQFGAEQQRKSFTNAFQFFKHLQQRQQGFLCAESQHKDANTPGSAVLGEPK